MWTSKLFWKLFLVYALLSLALVGGSLWRVAGLFKNFAEQQTGEALENICLSLTVQPFQGDAAQMREQLVERAKRIPLLREQRLLLLDKKNQAFYGPSLPGSDYDHFPEVQAAWQGRTLHSARTMPRGEMIVQAATGVTVDQQVQAVIFMTQTLPQLETQVVAVRRDLIVFAAVAVCCAIVLTYAVVGQIVRPLAQLSEGAQALAAENDQAIASFQSLDELGVLGAALNQMQLKLARRLKQLQENTERLEAVLGSMEEGVIAVDASEVVLLANEASCQMLEIGMIQPVGRLLLDVTRSLPLNGAVAEALQSRGTIQKEFETHGVVRRTLALRATCMVGEPCPGVMVVLHDITELRRLENLRREFVANVSHELKTPLAAIKAYAETLQMGALQDPEHSSTFIARIEEEAERLNELIMDLLQIARIEAGQTAFEVVELELSEAVLDCVDQYIDVAAAQKIALHVQGPEEPVLIRGDEEGVRTIFGNLINNAIKYTPAGGTVCVRWREEGSMALVEVEDTGIGIALKDQARVFERFYRVDKARSRALGGTGLGLSIVKHLTQAFGGTVGLESQPKRGSKFCIRLPLARVKTAAE